jgi:putative transposase
MNQPANLYHRHCFPDEIISHCTWLYFTFPLSFREIEKMMLYRGVFVTYETIRECTASLGNVLPINFTVVVPNQRESDILMK